MVIAWTRLFHAYFSNTVGDRYYKEKNGRYKLIDGERKSWELATCIKESKKLPSPVEKNLEFFIKLRNKIEHRHIEKSEVDALTFGECQALLYNYENLLVNLFGNDYALNEALVYSLQFSQLRTPQQNKASKAALSRGSTELVNFVKAYRNTLSDEDYSAQEFSIKLIQIPKISNASRSNAAIEFVRWDELSDEDKTAYQQIAVIIKDKTVKVAAANIKRYKATSVVKEVNKKLTGITITTNLHVILYKLFRIRPANGALDPFDTVAEFCLYDETHNDYVYQEAWIDFLVHFMQAANLTPEQLRSKEKAGELLNTDDYRF